MSTDRDTTRIVRSWLRTEENESADRVLGAVLDRLDTTPQRRATTRTVRRRSTMSMTLKFGLAAAVVAVAAFIGMTYRTPANVGAPNAADSESPSSTQAALGTDAPAGSPMASLEALRLPGMRPNEPAGEYGWQTGATPSGMHWVIQDGDSFRAISMLFASGLGCLEEGPAEPVPVRVGDHAGVLVEPYEPVKVFGSSNGGEVTRAYALEVDDRTLCVFVTRDRATTSDEWNAALGILETIKAQPIGREGVRITFTLPSGWDTG